MASLLYKMQQSKTRFQETPSYDGGLYDLGQKTYAWLVPNGAWGEANAGLVVGDGVSLLIDTLWDVPFTQQMLNAMQSITANAPIETVVNTHADGDHFFGNELLADKKSSHQKQVTTKCSRPNHNQWCC